MSIIIKDASLPKNCNECRLHDECGGCLASETVRCDYKSSRRPAECPLVDVDQLITEIAMKGWVNHSLYNADLISVGDVTRILKGDRQH